ncbi:MAG: hypothetical protein KHY93_09505 [Clostridiales bacterium]|nr:hypothetical protein [Clostridiales bacterium]
MGRMFYGIIKTCKLHCRSENIRFSAIGKKSKIDKGGCSDNLSNYLAAVLCL